MGYPITTTSDLPAPIELSLAPGLLSVPTPSFNYILFADKHAMPDRGGTTYRFIRPNALEPPIEELGNSGLEPASQVPSRDFIDSVMAFYGTSVVINEQVIYQNQDSAMAWITERLGVAMRQGEDLLLRNYLTSTASFINATGGSNGDNPTNVSATDFSRLAATLDNNNAFKFVTGKMGEDRLGTSPVRAGYILFAHTELQPDFDNIPEFQNAWNYPNKEGVLPAEFGALRNIRVLTSSQSKKDPGASQLGATVFENICAARQSYAHIQQDMYGMNIIYRDPLFSGPLAMNATLGVKYSQTQAILQQLWIKRFRCTARITI
jgi:N4-gp56 family major capsid protein